MVKYQVKNQKMLLKIKYQLGLRPKKANTIGKVRKVCHNILQRRETSAAFIYIYINMFWHSATSLWLVADFASVASYTTSPFGNIEPSRPRFCNDTTRSDHNTGNSVPYSFRTVRGFFYVPQDLWTMKNCETGPTVLSSLSEKTRKSNHLQM